MTPAAQFSPPDTGYASYPSLRGRTVFVTGGATGIGAELVAQFARQGARVGFVDIQAAAAAELAGHLGAELGSPPWHQACDVGDAPGSLRVERRDWRAAACFC